jgi:hypothetical protein
MFGKKSGSWVERLKTTDLVHVERFDALRLVLNTIHIILLTRTIIIRLRSDLLSARIMSIAVYNAPDYFTRRNSSELI